MWPCRAFAAVFDRSAQAHPDIVHTKVDTEVEQELAAAFGIRCIPTLMEFRDGVLVYNEPGALPPDALAGLIGQVTALDMGSVHAELASRGGA